jgi:hypothetical protein
MIVPEELSLGQEAKKKLAIPTYADYPDELVGLPYRVSAILRSDSGGVKEGIIVRLLDSSGKRLIGEKLTDTNGRVHFDLPSNEKVLFIPILGSDYVSIPASIMTAPVSISGTTLLNIFTNEWDWDGDSVGFVIQDKIRGTDLPSDDPREGFNLSEYFTTKNVLIAGGILLAIYIFRKGSNE